jgi:predicted SAM-dependent methyltransferase
LKKYWNGGISLKLALNIGSGSRVFPSTNEIKWINIDWDKDFTIPPNVEFLQIDVRDGLPFTDESVDIIYASHFLDHLNYYEALDFLKEAHRVLKKDGIMWIAVEDLDELINCYLRKEMDKFAHQQPPIFSQVKSQGLKLGMMLFVALAKLPRNVYRGHKMLYNFEGLKETLENCGFEVRKAEPTFMGIEESWPGKGHSIYVEARKK